MGCSIGGRIVLELALRHAGELRALIGLQSGAFVERYYDPSWLDHPEVHGGRACGAVAYGLMSPLSPQPEVWETVWHYMQGGPGIFTGDLYFYQMEGDIRGRIGEIDTSALSALPADRRVRLFRLAARHRGGDRARQRREIHRDERPRALPDEREPRRPFSATCGRCWRKSAPENEDRDLERQRHPRAPAQLCEWLERDRPDVVCLQELKAEAAQMPDAVQARRLPRVLARHARVFGRLAARAQGAFATARRSSAIRISTWSRASCRRCSATSVLASVYVPNGGKDYAAKLRS